MATLNLAVWSGPRNISTAMMRSWENRADTRVIDEPLYGYYLQETGIDHPMATEILKSSPTDWQAVVAELVMETNSPAIYYQKHISTHLLDQLPLQWCLQLCNCMLIREPERMVASYAKKRTDINARDFGYAEQLRLFEFLNNNGQQPIVIDTDRLLQQPKEQLQKWCSAINIDFDANMLSWPAGKRDTDGIWGAHWYDAVENSTGFKPYQPVETKLSKPLQAIANECRSAYETMLSVALS